MGARPVADLEALRLRGEALFRLVLERLARIRRDGRLAEPRDTKTTIRTEAGAS